MTVHDESQLGDAWPAPQAAGRGPHGRAGGPVTGVTAPGVGRTYRLDESDYRFGSGSLLVWVTRVLEPLEYDGEIWWQVEARCGVPGLAGPAGDRTLYLRASALPSSAAGRPAAPGRLRGSDGACAHDDPQ